MLLLNSHFTQKLYVHSFGKRNKNNWSSEAEYGDATCNISEKTPKSVNHCHPWAP